MEEEKICALAAEKDELNCTKDEPENMEENLHASAFGMID